MKILVVTPMYAIKDRKNLFHDSSAVHYLIKYWPKDVEILVINIYFNSIKAIGRYTKAKERKYHRNGYQYEVDGIKVEMIETQLLISQKNLNKVQLNRLNKNIQEVLEKNNFQNPDKLICHLPAYHVGKVIGSIEAKEKIAILHISDLRKVNNNSTYLKELENNFERMYTRSKPIYDFFKKANLKGLQDDIIYSGVPLEKKRIERNFKEINQKKFRLLYVGKLIARKNVDLVVKALSQFNGKVDFEFLIIGKGKEKNRITKLIKENKLEDKIKIIPELPREKVMKQMEVSDIFIMPSVRETLGLVYLEAMSKGCLTIGVIGEGIDGIIENGKNGLLIQPTLEDVKNVLNKIFNFSEDDFKKYSENAIKTTYEFEEKKISEKYYNIILNNENQR